MHGPCSPAPNWPRGLPAPVDLRNVAPRSSAPKPSPQHHQSHSLLFRFPPPFFLSLCLLIFSSRLSLSLPHSHRCNGPRRPHSARPPTVPHPMDPGLPPRRRMLGSHNTLYATRRHKLYSSASPLPHRSQQLVAEEEGAGGLVRGDWRAVAAGVRDPILIECHRECVVFCADWESW